MRLLIEDKHIKNINVQILALENTSNIITKLVPINNASFKEWSSISSLVQFPISNKNISDFQSLLNPSLTPLDCFINAAQLIGVIDNYTANVLRISQSDSNFPLEQIESIFLLNSGRDSGLEEVPYYNFTNLNLLGNSFDILIQLVKNNLKQRHCFFCGWYDNKTSNGHIFLIGRDSDDNYVYIDPQLPGTPCDLSIDECLKNVGWQKEEADRLYFILYKTDKIVPFEIIEQLGFDPSPGRSVNLQGTVF